MGGEDSVDVDVAVRGPVARWVAATLASSAILDESEDGIVVRLPVRHRDALRSWVLSLGPDATVLSPAEVVGDVVTWLEAIAGPAPEVDSMSAAKSLIASKGAGAATPALRWLRRTMAILAYLEERPGAAVPIAELAKRFNVKPVDLARDLERISCCGIPPYGPDDMYPLIVDDDEVQLDPVPWLRPSKAAGLTSIETVAVSTAGQVLLELTAADERTVLASGIAKVASRVNDHLRVVLDTPPHLLALRHAIGVGQVVAIDYFAASSRRVSEGRDILPIGVRMDTGRWLVDAVDMASSQRRTFRVDRILDLEPTDQIGVTVKVQAVKPWPPKDAPMVTLLAPSSDAEAITAPDTTGALFVPVIINATDAAVVAIPSVTP